MSKDSAKRSVVVDLRCLQDPDYARRGIGRHALALLRHAPSSLRLVGLTDATLPALLPEAREAVETVHLNAYAASRAGTSLCPPACFVMMSPMTHDPIFSARLLSDPTLLRTAVVYDFIPRRFPDRYLSGPAERLSYAVALHWLARCDLFAPISRGSAEELTALLGVPASKIAVTGCPIAPAFEGLKAAPERAPPRHLLVVGGGDPRKNPEVVIRAHARSPMMQSGKGIPLVIAGSYGEGDARAFRALAAEAGGRAELVEVPGHLPEADLLELYRRALALICASYDEGFSIPVVEGMAAALPCLVSDIVAHAELVVNADCRFPADDDAVLLPKLERMVADVGWQAATLARQADVWPRFRARAVAGRFWDAVLRGLDVRAPAVLRRYRPRVAMLSPLPPDRSGVADYTAATCVELGRLVDLHVFTETVRPSPLPNVASILPLGELPHLRTGFDRVISVVGNSHFHTRIFELLLRYGGACIAHDARMLGFYRTLLGEDRALATASRELGRAVGIEELNAWLADEGKLKALFLGEIAERATPSIVHSPVTVELFMERYGVRPAYVPFSIYRPWSPQELAPSLRESARTRLGFERHEIAISTFGFVHTSKAPEECIWALHLLRGWGIPASLHFVGNTDSLPEKGTALRRLARDLGLSSKVHFAEDFVSEQTYRDYLLASDLGIQLRTYAHGGLSGGLLDCAAAGLPVVANESLAAAVGTPPSYTRCIPDTFSPLVLAEALADLMDARPTPARREEDRLAFSEERSCTMYAQRLCAALSLETAVGITKGRVAHV